MRRDTFMSRRLLSWGIILMAFSVLMSACSSGSNKEANTATATEQATATKVVKDYFGEVTVPEKPKNVLVLSSIYAEYLIEMGVPPQMVIFVPEVEPDYRAPYFEKNGIQMIEAEQYQYNYEQLLSLSPDLIVGIGIGMEPGTYEELSKIAPTVAINADSEMKTAMPLLASIFDKTETSKQVLAAFDVKAKQAREQIQQAIGDKTVLILRVESERYRVMGPKAANSSAFFYQTLGLHSPEAIKDSTDWFSPISLEALPDMNPDYIFVEDRILKDHDNTESMKKLKENKVWASLTAVKNDHVFPLKTSDFVHGVGPVGSVLLMNNVVEKLVK